MPRPDRDPPAEEAGQHAAPPHARNASEVAKRLGLVVEQEARRALNDAQLQPDPVRIAAGWERRFIADEARAEEAMSLYRDLGYEACADPVRTDELDEECTDCWLLTNLRFVTIYTRRRG